MNIRCYDQYGNVITRLTQWDINRELRITGYDYTTTPIFHFAHNNDEEALTQIGVVDGEYVKVSVPNILLQTAERIRVYIYIHENDIGTTVYKLDIPVDPKPKPNDYVYSDNTEVILLSELKAELEEAIKSSQEKIDAKILEIDTNVDNKINEMNELSNTLSTRMTEFEDNQPYLPLSEDLDLSTLSNDSIEERWCGYIATKAVKLTILTANENNGTEKSISLKRGSIATIFCNNDNGIRRVHLVSSDADNYYIATSIKSGNPIYNIYQSGRINDDAAKTSTTATYSAKKINALIAEAGGGSGSVPVYTVNVDGTTDVILSECFTNGIGQYQFITNKSIVDEQITAYYTPLKTNSFTLTNGTIIQVLDKEDIVGEDGSTMHILELNMFGSYMSEGSFNGHIVISYTDDGEEIIKYKSAIIDDNYDNDSSQSVANVYTIEQIDSRIEKVVVRNSGKLYLSGFLTEPKIYVIDFGADAGVTENLAYFDSTLSIPSGGLLCKKGTTFIVTVSDSSTIAGQVFANGDVYRFDYNKTENTVSIRQYVNDENYVHTDNNFTTVEKDKLANLSILNWKRMNAIDLPSEYTQVTSLNFTGQQVFDTGFTPTGDTRFVIKYSDVSYSSGWKYFFGAEDTSTQNKYTLYTTNRDGWANTHIDFNYGTTHNELTIKNLSNKVTEYFKENEIHIGIVDKTVSTLTFNIGRTLYIGANHNSDTAPYYDTATLHSFKLYQFALLDSSGNILHSYYPVYKTEGSTVTTGLYDVIDKRFIESITGTQCDYTK